MTEGDVADQGYQHELVMHIRFSEVMHTLCHCQMGTVCPSGMGECLDN